MQYLESISFTIPGDPFGKERPRVVVKDGRSKAYTPTKTHVYENDVRTMFLIEAGNLMFPDDVPLRVKITAYYSIPKSTSKKKRQEMLDGVLRPLKKPDFDNVGKAVCDSLNKIAYHDDAMVVDARIQKFYSDDPRVEVTISTVNYSAINCQA